MKLPSKKNEFGTAALYCCLNRDDNMDTASNSISKQAAFFGKSSGIPTKVPIYKTRKIWYFDIGSFPISHPLGPRGAICRAAPFYTRRQHACADFQAR